MHVHRSVTAGNSIWKDCFLKANENENRGFASKARAKVFCSDHTEFELTSLVCQSCIFSCTHYLLEQNSCGSTTLSTSLNLARFQLLVWLDLSFPESVFAVIFLRRTFLVVSLWINVHKMLPCRVTLSPQKGHCRKRPSLIELTKSCFVSSHKTENSIKERNSRLALSLRCSVWLTLIPNAKPKPCIICPVGVQYVQEIASWTSQRPAIVKSWRSQLARDGGSILFYWTVVNAMMTLQQLTLEWFPVTWRSFVVKQSFVFQFVWDSVNVH